MDARLKLLSWLRLWLHNDTSQQNIKFIKKSWGWKEIVHKYLCPKPSTMLVKCQLLVLQSCCQWHSASLYPSTLSCHIYTLIHYRVCKFWCWNVFFSLDCTAWKYPCPWILQLPHPLPNALRGYRVRQKSYSVCQRQFLVSIVGYILRLHQVSVNCLQNTEHTVCVKLCLMSWSHHKKLCSCLSLDQ